MNERKKKQKHNQPIIKKKNKLYYHKTPTGQWG